MKFTVENIARSLAEHLAPVLPGVRFYENPHQQGTKLPCAFLQQRYSNIKPRIGGRFFRVIGLDLTYLVAYNRPDMQERYQEAAEAMDRVMETFPYTDGEETTLLRTYSREWRIDLDAMHYKFELRVWESPEREQNPMQTLQHHEEVTDGTETGPTAPVQPGSPAP